MPDLFVMHDFEHFSISGLNFPSSMHDFNVNLPD